MFKKVFNKWMFCLAAIYIAFANSASADDILLQCSITPHVVPLVEKPKVVGNTNNLRRKTGLIQNAEGKAMYFQGRVVDKDCVPISDAVVTLWHADSEGNYVDAENKDQQWDQYFMGSGTSFTDNLGRYSFITVIPGSVGGMAPVLHLSVEHQNFKLYETDIFLDDHLPVDIIDMPYIDFSIDTLNQLTAFSKPIDQLNVKGGRIYEFPITMTEKELFRRF